jgi:hypothetical protein
MFRCLFHRLFHRRCVIAFALVCFAVSTANACPTCATKAAASTATANVNVLPAPPAPANANATANVTVQAAPAVQQAAPVMGLFSLPPTSETVTTTTTTTTSNAQTAAMGVVQPMIVAAPVAGVQALAVRLGPLQRLRLAHEENIAARRSAVLLTQAQTVTSASAAAIASTGATVQSGRRLRGCR